MKIKKLSYWILPFLLLFLFSCNEKLESEYGGDGWLSVEFLKDKQVVEARAGEEDNYMLEIQKEDGTIVGKYNYSELGERITLKQGKYTVIATNGEDVEAGFEKPFYMDSQEITIDVATTKAITMVCSLANVKFTVDYSQKVKDNFPNYYLEITNGNENGILVFEKEENRAGYIKLNDQGTLEWKLSLDNGQETHVLRNTITDVEPRQHYKFYFDIKESGDNGSGIPNITVDTTLNIVNHYIVIDLDDNASAPVIYGQDFELDEVFVVSAEERGVNARINVEAEGTIQKMSISHNSNVLAGMGIPTVFTPSSISTEEAIAINNAGITWTSIILNQKEAWIDFSSLLNNTALEVGEYAFSIEVVDSKNQLGSEDFKVEVVSNNTESHLPEEVGEMEVWATFTTLSGKWITETMPTGMTIEYSTDQQNWIKVENPEYDNENKVVKANIQGLSPSTTYYYRTVSDDYTPETVYSFTTDIAEQYPYLNFDTWYEVKSGIGNRITTHYLGESGGTQLWDSGNKGANTLSSVNPTSPEYTDIINKEGNIAAVKLETKSVNLGLTKIMAAGSIYTGNFGKVSGAGAELKFGQPYTSRPTTLKGYYKYQSKAIDNTSLDYIQKGDLDSCHVYIALFSDWDSQFTVNTNTSTFVDLSTAMAFGELKDSRTMDDYEEFTINIEYRDMTKRPKYILIVAAASKYGDYFTGGVGSVLLLDEFELGFDAPLDN